MHLGCMHCGQPLNVQARICPTCGADRAAPACISCGHLVSSRLGAWVFDDSWNGHQPWNTQWDGHCEHCGASQEPVLDVRSDVPDGTSSNMRFLSSYDSTFAHDLMLETPTVTIEIARVLSPHWCDGRSLPESVTVTLTHDELRTLVDAMNGPLSVLMARKSISKDVT